MPQRRHGRTFAAGCTALAILAGAAVPAAAEPPRLSIGYGPASDVTLLLIQFEPQIATRFGKSYTIDFTEFRGSDARFTAFISGGLEGATGSANALLAAASKGIDFVIVASVSKETVRGFSTLYMVRSESEIHNVADLKDKTIGLDGRRSSTELWARIAVEKAGLNPDRDVKFVAVGFPAQATALQSGKIDLGVFPQPFAAIADERGGFRPLFRAKDAVPDDEELQLLFFSRAALQAHPQAVRDFLADVAAVTRFYLEYPDDARRALLQAKAVAIPEAIYMKMADYDRSPTLSVDVAALTRMQDTLVKMGYQEKKADVGRSVDLSFLPK